MGFSGFSQTSTQMSQVGMVPLNTNQDFSQSQSLGQGSGWWDSYKDKKDFSGERPQFGRSSAAVNEGAWFSNQQKRGISPRDRSRDNRQQAWQSRGSDNRPMPSQPDFRSGVKPDDRTGFLKPRPDFRPNDRPGLLQKPRPEFGFAEGRQKPFSGRPNDFSGRPNRFSGRPNVFSERPEERQARSNERDGFFGRSNEFAGRSNEFAGRSNERRGPNEFSGRSNDRQRRPNEHQGSVNEYSERRGRPNDRATFGRANERDQFIRSNDRSLPRRGHSDREGRPERSKSDFPGSRKRKFDERIDNEMERPERVSRPKTFKQSFNIEPVCQLPVPEVQSKPMTEVTKVKQSKRMFRTGVRKIVFEIYSSLGIQDIDVILRQSLRNLVTERLKELLSVTLPQSNFLEMVPPAECLQLYRATYPVSEDQAAYNEALAAVEKPKADAALAPGNTTFITFSCSNFNYSR